MFYNHISSSDPFSSSEVQLSSGEGGLTLGLGSYLSSASSGSSYILSGYKGIKIGC